ncbi:MAG TPA: extensin family protein [Terriglobales bacterium]|nr:extensin family protein [Terriglobales bacterium]
MGSIAKTGFSRCLVAAALATAECTGVVVVEVPLTTTPSRAQFFDDQTQLYRPSRQQSGPFFENLFEPTYSRKPRKRSHRSGHSSRKPPQHKKEEKGRWVAPQVEKPSTKQKPVRRDAGSTVAIPLPRPRLPPWTEPRSFAEAAGPGFDRAEVTSAPTDCDQRLAAVAGIELLPRLIGPGKCGGRDMVELDFVRLPNHSRVEVKPPAILRCPTAESFVAWIRDEVSPRINMLGGALRGVEDYGSYECRSRNHVPGAKLSEHAKGNAIDVLDFILAHGRRIKLTDMTVPKVMRDELRNTACHRFTTVLGPGADTYHNGHIHLDNIMRKNGYRICEWDVREPPPPSTESANTHDRPPAKSVFVHPVTVGPWAIARTYNANKLINCTMSRSAGALKITFVRDRDDLLLVLSSPKWKLDRGRTYSLRLVAGSRSVEAKALAEAKSVTIALESRRFKAKIRSANALEVRGKGATLRVPLDRSSAALERLDECFEKNGREKSKTNPFIAPSRNLRH